MELITYPSIPFTFRFKFSKAFYSDLKHTKMDCDSSRLTVTGFIGGLRRAPINSRLVIKKIYNGVYQPISIFLYICYQSIYSSFPSIHLLSIWIIVIPRCYSISDGLVFSNRSNLSTISMVAQEKKQKNVSFYGVCMYVRPKVTFVSFSSVFFYAPFPNASSAL